MKRWYIVAIMSMILMGCGTKLIYDNLDWIAIEYIEDFFELSDTQQNLVSESFQQATGWHRSSEIPSYIAQLDELLLLTPETLSQTQFEQQELRFREHSFRLLDHFFPFIVSIVAQMSNEQVEQFMHELRVRHAKFKREYTVQSDLEIHSAYQEQIENNLTDWLGPLTTEQQALIVTWAEQLQLTTPLWFNYQTQIRVELGKMFARRSQRQELETSLAHLLYNPQQYYSPQLKKGIEHNTHISKIYLIQIINVMTPEQTDLLRKELMDWREIAYELVQ